MFVEGRWFPITPTSDAAAVVADIRLLNGKASSAPGSTDCMLSGTITRLALEKASGEVRASILVAGVPLTVVFPSNRSRSRPFIAGAGPALLTTGRASAGSETRPVQDGESP